MTWDGGDYWCDNCRGRITGSEHDPVCDSVAYAPNLKKGYDLCKPCSNEEEAEYEREGSNAMPHRTKRYAANRAAGFGRDD